MDLVRKIIRSLRPYASAFALVCLVGLTVVIRLIGLSTAHDVFVDEATYARLGGSVANGNVVPVLFGRDFYLQPPLFFWLLGLVEKVIGQGSSLVDLVMRLRLVNLAFAGVSGALVFVIARRLADARGALAAGCMAACLFALDPLLAEYDGLVMLETLTTTLTLAGWWVVLRAVERETAPRSWAVAAGLLFGAALLTKETAFFVFAPALALAFAINRWLERAWVAVVLLAASVAYVATFAFLVVVGSPSAFLDQKSQALQRLVGTLRVTGFKAPGAPSFASKIIENLPHYGATYVLMILGSLAVALLLWRGSKAQRVFAAAIAGEMVVIAYDLTIGGLVEQQHFYLFVAPACVAVAVVAAESLMAYQRAVARAAIIVLAMVFALDAAGLAVNRTAAEDGYARLDQYLAAHYRAQPTVLSTTETWQLLSARPFLVTRGTPLTTQAHNASTSLVLTSTKQIGEGYASVGPEIYDELRADEAQVIWTYDDWDNGTLELWLLPGTSPRFSLHR